MFVSRVTRNANPSWLSSWRKNINYEAVLIYISLRPRKSYYFVIVISRLFMERRTYLLTYLLTWLHEWKEVDFLHRMFAKRGRKKNRRRINEISWFSCYSFSFVHIYVLSFVDRSFHPAHGLLLFLFRGFVANPRFSSLKIWRRHRVSISL